MTEAGKISARNLERLREAAIRYRGELLATYARNGLSVTLGTESGFAIGRLSLRDGTFYSMRHKQNVYVDLEQFFRRPKQFFYKLLTELRYVEPYLQRS